VPLGFNPSHVLTMTVDARAFSANTSADERLRAYNSAADAVRRLAGVDRVAIGLPVPLSDTRLTQRYATGAEAPEQVATQFIALPGYAETLHVPLRAGRTFTTADNVRSDPGVLVDERLAASAWPGRRAVGQRLMLGPSGGMRTSAEVIGVVAHVQTIDLRADARPQIWVTYPTRLFFQMSIVVRAHGDPAASRRPSGRPSSIWALAGRWPTCERSRITFPPHPPIRGSRCSFQRLRHHRRRVHLGRVYGVVAYTTASARARLPSGGRRRRRARDRDAGAARRSRLDGRRRARGLLGARLLARWLESLLFQVKTTDAPTLSSSPRCLQPLRSSRARCPQSARSASTRWAPCGRSKPHV